MTHWMTVKLGLGCWILALVATGCSENGGAGSPQTAEVPATTQGTGADTKTASGSGLVTAAIGSDLVIPLPGDHGNSAEAPDFQLPKLGTPEWRLFEITQLIVPPPTMIEAPNADGSVDAVPRNPAEVAAERANNLKSIVQHAGQVIAATHQDPTKEQVFNNAVHYLCTAEVELALSGDAESAQHLSEVAETLYEEKPGSFAASEAAYRLVDLAHKMSIRYSRRDANWALAHATQSRLFAERFPKEESRVCVALMDAGRQCEAVGFIDEARACYYLIEEKYPQSPHADRIIGTIRRLRLEGRKLTPDEFAGPTIDGGFISIDQFSGKYVLVAFWTSDSQTFQADLPTLRKLRETHGDQLAFIGVNLDIDEFAADQFAAQAGLPWRQIFFSEPEKRGASNVVAQYYGVTTVPTYWLIGPDQTVLKAPADIHDLPIPSAKPAE